MGWIRRLQNTLLGSTVSDDFNEEARFHLEQRTEENVRRGMSARDARAEATRRFGNVTLAQERTRDADMLLWLDDLRQDLRYAVRMLRRNPGFAAVAVLSLALGIGACTAIFSVVNALLLKPLPYPDPDRLAALWLRAPGINIPRDWPSPGQFIDLQNENRSFEAMSISQGRAATLVGHDQPERVEALLTSSSLFDLLGAKPLYGRLLLPDEDRPGRPPVAILSYDFWRRLFDADPSVVGKSITLFGLGQIGGGENKNQFTVAGVLRPDFLLNDEVMPTADNLQKLDLFLPLPLGADAASRRGDENYNLMARLKPGVTMAQAQGDVSVIAARIREKDKRDRTFTISVVPLVEQVVGDVRRALLVLFGSVALVLLIACANVANLLLARASARQKELAVRVALGASWQALVRQLLTESILLGLAGGAAGLLIAKASLSIVHAINPGNIPRLDAIGIDAAVLAFTAGVSILTGVLFGLAPAWRAAHVDLNASLKSGGRNGNGDVGLGSSRPPMRSLLVVSELAFSLVLLVGAGLLIRSFVRLRDVAPGFNPDHVISMRVGNDGRQFPNRDAAVAFYLQLAERIARVPGVTARGAVTSLPFTSSNGWGSINVEGFTPQPGQELQVDRRAATPDYFRAMGIPLVKGRFFTNADGMPNAHRVALVDEKFARRFWPGEEAVGKQLWDDPERRMTVVGVVGTVKQYGLDVDGRIVVYQPSFGLLQYQVARTPSDPSSTAAAIVQAIHDLDPTVPVYDVRTMPDRMKDSLARQRFSTLMLGAFALFALILAVVGVYGVMSHLVAQGTHDIGVRIALGAQRRTIIGMVVRRGMEVAGAGIVAGLAGAAALTRVMTSLLFGTSATDAVTFSAVPVLLAAVALFASYVPARRATRVDPVVALRNE
ncbi:MAG TPA: ABC transporter permease [Vicinamibacterales bacterium]|jgi:predicted permease|nr:ABC transporter permease [Vicinamibacterales bacterium]